VQAICLALEVESCCKHAVPCQHGQQREDGPSQLVVNRRTEAPECRIDLRAGAEHEPDRVFGASFGIER